MIQLNHQTLGYFGKLPSHGDFINRYLPNTFINPWDQWLQETMIACKESLPENWIATYMTMPVYRFALSPGICGETAWVGILMPSRDYSGRLFPFTMAVPLLPNEISTTQTPSSHDVWLKKLQTIALTTLTPDFTQDRLTDAFDQAIKQLQGSCPNIATNPADVTKGILQTQTQNQFAWHTKLNGSHATQGIADALDATLKEYSFAYSMWWTDENTDLMITQGLPKANMMPALFDNDWERWGWKNNKYTILPSSPEIEAGEDRTITL